MNKEKKKMQLKEQRMKYLVIVIFICGMILTSCGSPSLDSHGGISIVLTSADVDGSVEKDKSILKKRLSFFTPYPELVSVEVDGNQLVIGLVEAKDEESIRKVISNDPSMKIVYALPPSKQKALKERLSDFMVSMDENAPYKIGSETLWIDKKNESAVRAVIEKAKDDIPQIGRIYLGREKVGENVALFVEDRNSPFIDETMFDHFASHENVEDKEGELSLKLKNEYADRIGKVTGNDSTYLLHVFHEKVYISKIIKPHITSPAFGMAGGLSVSDVLVLDVLHHSEALENEWKIEEIKVLEAK